MKVIMLALLLSACAKDNGAQKPTQEPEPRTVAETRRFYCESSKAAVQDRRGAFGGCDDAGFTSLHAIACADIYAVDLSVFDDAGRPHRNADHAKCWDYDKTDAENAALGHRSGFSRDHVLMRMVAAWVQKDLGWVDRFVAYAEPRHWQFCNAANDVERLTRCTMSPQLLVLLSDMRQKLGGSRLKVSASLVPDDFEAHLRVWRIWLSGQIYGGISDPRRQDLEQLAARETGNALYQAVWSLYRDGDMTQTFELLRDERHWPRDRLPNSQEHHCTDYLFQRDMLRAGAPNADWLPCPDKPREEWPGTDYAIAAWMAGAH